MQNLRKLKILEPLSEAHRRYMLCPRLIMKKRLKIAPQLPEAQTLVREMQTFQVKISLDTAHDSYGAWREGTHDDLVLAVALALWKGMRDARPRLPVAESSTYSIWG
jgi:hypothetical protein